MMCGLRDLGYSQADEVFISTADSADLEDANVPLECRGKTVRAVLSHQDVIVLRINLHIFFTCGGLVFVSIYLFNTANCLNCNS